MSTNKRRPERKTLRNKNTMKAQILQYLDEKDEFVFIGELHHHMTKIGFHKIDVARAFSALRNNFHIVYHIHQDEEGNRIIYIASVPEDIREDILNFYTESYRRAEKGARKSALSVLLNHYPEKWREGINI